MGLIYVDIKLANTVEEQLSRMNKILPEEVKSIQVNALVDTAASYLCINENIANQLGLETRRTDIITVLADGTQRKCNLVGPITIYFLTRSTVVEAIVLPGDEQPLLGAIPMESMDVIIDPLTQQLGVPPSRPYMIVAQMRGVKTKE
ncbi:MAG: hypothetical protein JWO06_2967 [Bacteroidota bacterium]|nr:hypothetical protein [Bacteroidota bacterium]